MKTQSIATNMLFSSQFKDSHLYSLILTIIELMGGQAQVSFEQMRGQTQQPTGPTMVQNSIAQKKRMSLLLSRVSAKRVCNPWYRIQIPS